MSINQVVCHGCVVQELFALYTEMTIRSIKDMGGTVISKIMYTDDTVIIAESESQLQQLITL